MTSRYNNAQRGYTPFFSEFKLSNCVSYSVVTHRSRAHDWTYATGTCIDIEPIKYKHAIITAKKKKICRHSMSLNQTRACKPRNIPHRWKNQTSPLEYQITTIHIYIWICANANSKLKIYFIWANVGRYYTLENSIFPKRIQFQIRIPHSAAIVRIFG